MTNKQKVKSNKAANVEERINKKNKRKEFRVRYYYYDGDKRKQKRTAWYLSIKEARSEAEEKIKEFEHNSLSGSNVNHNELNIYDLLDIYIKSLENELSKVSYERRTTVDTYLRRAKSLLSKYTYDEIGNIKLVKLKVSDFKDWVRLINKENLAGTTVRNYVAIILRFNQFLFEENYYSESDESFVDRVSYAIERVSLKKKEVGKRVDRHELTIDELHQLSNVYVTEGLGHFENMYWYTLFNVLYFTGLRVEELIALRWCDFTIKKQKYVFDVRNAISEREIEEEVLSNIKNNKFKTKNKGSQRLVNLFKTIDYMVLDYQVDYQRKFGITEQEMQDKFIFPLYNGKQKQFYINRYQKQKNLLRKLDKMCKVAGLPKTDMQMFRHAFAGFMVRPVSDGGLGFNPDDVKDIVGHSSDRYILEVYAEYTKEEKFNKQSEVFKGLYNIVSDGIDVEDENKQTVQNRFINDDSLFYIKEFRKKRIREQILIAIEKKQEVFVYNLIEAPAIADVIKTDYLESNKRRNYMYEIIFRPEYDDLECVDKCNYYTEEEKKKVRISTQYIVDETLKYRTNKIRNQIKEAIKNKQEVYSISLIDASIVADVIKFDYLESNKKSNYMHEIIFKPEYDIHDLNSFPYYNKEEKQKVRKFTNRISELIGNK